MKICFLPGTFLSDPGATVNGSQVQVMMVASELQHRGHEVTVLARASGERAAGSSEDFHGVRVDYYNAGRIPWAGSMRVVGALRALRPDVVYVRGRSYLTGAAAWYAEREGARVVWATNGEDGCERFKGLDRLWASARPVWRKSLLTPVHLIADLMCHYGIRHADAIVNQTAHQQERLLSIWGREGRLIRSLQEPPAELPEKAEPPIVLWLGRIAPYKGPESFVRLSRALKDLPCRFVMTGPATDAAYLARVLEPAREVTNFEYTGPVSLEGSWRAIAAASVLVNTSSMEGVSNALVQAWWCATPTVVMSLDPDGLVAAHGAGVAAGSFEATVDAVRRLVDEPSTREAMGERARLLAETEFSREAIGARYEEVLREVTARA